jgi:hypothetical protein
MVDIANAMGIPELTLRTIRKHADKIMESCESAMRMRARKIMQIRVPIMKKLEWMLAQQIEHQHQCAFPLYTMIIQAKQLTEFVKHIDTANGVTDNNDASRDRCAKVTRMIKSAEACYKELYSKKHVSYFSITSSRELKAGNPADLQECQSSLIVFYTHQHPVSHLIKLCTFIAK